MKTAIILNGHIRTFDRVKERFIKVFGGLNPDIFVTTYDNRFGYAPYIQQIQNFYEDYVLEEKQINEMLVGLNIIDIVIDNNEAMDKKVTEEYPSIKMKFKDFPDFWHSCYSQYRKLKLGFNMIKDYETKNNFKYDMIIKTRFDLMFYENMNFSVGKNDVLIDSGNVSPNDVFFMCERDKMFHVIDFIYNEFFELTDPDSERWPPHSILASAFRSANLNVISRPLIEYVERFTIKQKY
jgi:hypothetical protein